MKKSGLASLPVFLIVLAFFFIVCKPIGAQTDPGHQAVRIMKYSALGPPPSRSSQDREREGIDGGWEEREESLIGIPTTERRKRSIPHPSPARMIVKTAELMLEVRHYGEAISKITGIALEYRGYIVRSATTAAVPEERSISGEIVLRIPTERFDTVIARIRTIAQKVEQEIIRGNDVTEEFIDLAARLQNKQRAEKQYQAILQRAKSVKDLLQVEEALADVREEIEQLTGRKKYLSDQSDLSTIILRIHEPQVAVVQAKPTFGQKIGAAVQQGVNGFTEVMAVLLTMIIAAGPYFLVLFLSYYAAIRLWKARYREE